MSSEPFRQGMPVMDKIPQKRMDLVLRSRTRESMIKKICSWQRYAKESDILLMRGMGYRPDSPVPVSMYFAWVSVRPGGAGAFFRNEAEQRFWSSYRGKGSARATMIY